MGLSVTMCTLLAAWQLLLAGHFPASLCLGLCVGSTCLAEWVFSLSSFPSYLPIMDFSRN